MSTGNPTCVKISSWTKLAGGGGREYVPRTRMDNKRRNKTATGRAVGVGVVVVVVGVVTLFEHDDDGKNIFSSLEKECITSLFFRRQNKPQTVNK